jgi:acetylornithine aminotransferase/acetylornithine/N-succinyldiaminopimelate aminotransferase
MLAVEVPGGGAPDIVRRALLEHRLVCNATGPTTIRLLPPLTVSDEELDEALRRLAAALSSTPNQA